MKKKDNFVIQLVIGKFEFDGNAIEPFVLLDYQETVIFDSLEKKLEEFYKKGKEKIKEIKEIIK